MGELFAKRMVSPFVCKGTAPLSASSLVAAAETSDEESTFTLMRGWAVRSSLRQEQ